MTKMPFAVNNGRPSGTHDQHTKRGHDRHSLSLANGTTEGALKGWETRRANAGAASLEAEKFSASIRGTLTGGGTLTGSERKSLHTKAERLHSSAAAAHDAAVFEPLGKGLYGDDFQKANNQAVSHKQSSRDHRAAAENHLRESGTMPPGVGTGVTPESEARERIRIAKLANGTTEGALKGWETRRAGGGASPKPVTTSSVFGGMTTFPEGMADDDNRSIVGSPANINFSKEGRLKGYGVKGMEKRDSSLAAEYQAERAERSEKSGNHSDAIARHIKAAGHFTDAIEAEPHNAAHYKAKFEKHSAASKRLYPNASEPKPDALANGEFKLFEKGDNTVGDDDKADKKCDCKSGESCDKCKDGGKDGGKKAWVPPWKKDGVENSVGALSNGKPCGDSHIPDSATCHAGEGNAPTSKRDGGSFEKNEEKYLSSIKAGSDSHDRAMDLTKSAVSPSNSRDTDHRNAEFTHAAAVRHYSDAASHARSMDEPYMAGTSSIQAGFHRDMADSHKEARAGFHKDREKAQADFKKEWSLNTDRRNRRNELHASHEIDRRKVSNAGNSDGAKAGWLTRKGGIRVDHEYEHEDGSGKQVKLTIQGQEDGQKDIEMHLPKDVHTAIAAGQWKPNGDLERHSGGEDFHTIHGYEPVSQAGGVREKYGKGSEPDKANGVIGQNLARAKAYYARAKSFDDGSPAQHALKAKAEHIIKEIHDKHHPALLAAKAAHVSPLGNRDYATLLNSFRGGLLKNYIHDEQEMLDEVADYASNGEVMPDDLREQYEEWLDNQD